MTYDGNGTFNRPVADYVFDTVISETDMNTEMSGMATGLSTAITKDGQTTITANIPMNSKKLTGLTAGSATTDSVTLEQVQADAFTYQGTDSGAADAYVIALSPPTTTQAAGLRVAFVAANASTGASTLNAGGGADAIEYQGSALTGAEIAAGSTIVCRHDGTAWQMTSPSALSGSGDVVGPGSATDGGTATFDGTTGKLLKDGVVLGTVATLDTGTGSGNVPLVGTKSASTTLAGLVEQSTSAENVTGSDDTVFPSVAGAQEIVHEHAITLGAPVASTSGTSIDFTSIPSGTKKVTISLVGASTSGSSVVIFQLGDSGGVETSGYLGASSFVGTTTQGSANYTAGFGVLAAGASSTRHGTITLTLVDAATFTWAASASFAASDTTFAYITAGSKSLSAELDRVRITTAGGSDTFDAGKINITYE